MSKKKKVIIISIGMVVLMCAFCLSAVGILNLRPRQEMNDKGEIAPIESTFKTPDEYQGKIINLLVAGRDNSVGLTDVLMYISVDLEKNSANVFRIPRDTFVGDDIPSGKMNAVYNYPPDGMSNINGLIKKINEMFALPVDHYVTITLEGFRNVIDSMGGIDIEVPQTIYYDEMKGQIIPEGPQHLDGEKAEWFVRYRAGYANADLGRIDAQNLFMQALMKKCKDMGKIQLAALLADDYEYITTDMTIGEIISIANAAFGVDLTKVQMMTAPGNGASHNGLSIFQIDADATAEMLNEYFRPYSAKVEADALDIPVAYSSYGGYGDYGDDGDDGTPDDTPSRSSGGQQGYTPAPEEPSRTQPPAQTPSEPEETTPSQAPSEPSQAPSEPDASAVTSEEPANGEAAA